MIIPLNKQISACRRCPRLVAHASQVRERHPDYHAQPVGSWGATNPRVVIVGLAPGLHGAGRTGRAFVGDSSGAFLFESLYRSGLASDPDPANARLNDLRITNIVKCLPPGNAPTTLEIKECRSHLRAELDRYFPERARKPRILVTLGGTAHNAVVRTLGNRSMPFVHGSLVQLNPRRHIICAYHPSRLNVNTKKLTAQMLDDVFDQVRQTLDKGSI